jgi:hypothetical protein
MNAAHSKKCHAKKVEGIGSGVSTNRGYQWRVRKAGGGVQLSLPPSTRLCDSLTGGKIKQSIFEINLAERAVLAFAFPVEGTRTEMIEAHCEAP